MTTARTSYCSPRFEENVAHGFRGGEDGGEGQGHRVFDPRQGEGDGRGHARPEPLVRGVEHHVDGEHARAVGLAFGCARGDAADRTCQSHIPQRIDADVGLFAQAQPGDVDFIDVGPDHQGGKVRNFAKEGAAVLGGGAGDDLSLGQVPEQQGAVVRGADDGLGELVAQVGGPGLVDGGVVLRQRERDAGFVKVLGGDETTGLQTFLAVEIVPGALRAELGRLDAPLGLLQLGEGVLLVEAENLRIARHFSRPGRRS
jgi:hypothetical protein